MQAGGGWIPLPERIAGTKAVINPHNNDDYCFIYTVQLGLSISPENTIVSESLVYKDL